MKSEVTAWQKNTSKLDLMDLSELTNPFTWMTTKHQLTGYERSFSIFLQNLLLISNVKIHFESTIRSTYMIEFLLPFRSGLLHTDSQTQHNWLKLLCMSW